MFIETHRLFLRELIQDDYEDVEAIMQDDEVMFAYDGPMTDDEVQAWLYAQKKNYAQYGYCLFAVIEKESNTMIGQCGLSMQDWKGEERLEIRYFLNRKYWGLGYAIEAAIACREYAFARLKAKEVVSIIHNTNARSIRVAERNGMVAVDQWEKEEGKDPLILYQVEFEDESRIHIPINERA